MPPRQLSVPAPLPAVNFTLEANDAVRYYQNVCEYGYREAGRPDQTGLGTEVQNMSVQFLPDNLTPDNMTFAYHLVTKTTKTDLL